jgi:hypothetical protein
MSPFPGYMTLWTTMCSTGSPSTGLCCGLSSTAPTTALPRPSVSATIRSLLSELSRPICLCVFFLKVLCSSFMLSAYRTSCSVCLVTCHLVDPAHTDMHTQLLARRHSEVCFPVRNQFFFSFLPLSVQYERWSTHMVARMLLTDAAGTESTRFSDFNGVCGYIH